MARRLIGWWVLQRGGRSICAFERRHPGHGRVLMLEWLTRLGTATYQQGSKFFKRAQAAERYAGKKQGKYNRLLQQFSLKKKVEIAAVLFEVSGGFSASATSLFDSITAAASKNGAQLAAGEWSWFYTQVLSFEINKLTALAVLNGLREAAAAAAPAAI